MKMLFDLCYSLLTISLSIEGFTISLWQVFIFTGLAVLAFKLIYGIFD